jgi:hypothetical protein
MVSAQLREQILFNLIATAMRIPRKARVLTYDLCHVASTVTTVKVPLPFLGFLGPTVAAKLTGI